MMTKETKLEIEDLKDRLKTVEGRYWELYHKIGAIHEHLGVVQQTIPTRTVLTKKGGPEQG